MTKKLIMAATIVLLTASGITAKTFNDSIPSGKNFNKAAFRLWYADTINTIKGILLLVPGSNVDGRGMADDAMWQNFATQFGFAVLACYYTDHPHELPSIESYTNAKEGSGQALLDVLSQFAKTTGQAELATARMVSWGMSAGGQFIYELLCWRPDRIIAFMVNKGGIYYTALAPKEARKVPGIIFVGELDLVFRNDILMGIFSINRRFGALWAVIVEPGKKHEIGNSITYTKKFYNEIIPLRLRDDGTLVSIEESSGYICDPTAMTCEPASAWQRKNYPTSWLPNEKMTREWRDVTGASF